MKLYHTISFIFYMIFSLVMIFLFYNGLMYPEETNYWIITFGLPILILEICSLFVPILLANMIMYRSYDGWPLYSLIVIMVIAFCFTYFFNIILFFYFLLSSIIKFIVFKNKKNQEDFDEAIGGLGITAVSILISMIVATILITLFSDFFSYQIQLIEEFIYSQIPPNVEIVGNMEYVLGGLISFWGILYFSISLLLNLLFKIKYKFRKENVSSN